MDCALKYAGTITAVPSIKDNCEARGKQMSKVSKSRAPHSRARVGPNSTLVCPETTCESIMLCLPALGATFDGPELTRAEMILPWNFSPNWLMKAKLGAVWLTRIGLPPLRPFSTWSVFHRLYAGQSKAWCQ